MGAKAAIVPAGGVNESGFCGNSLNVYLASFDKRPVVLSCKTA